MTWSTCNSNLVIISSLDSKWQCLKVGIPVFQLYYEIKLKTSKSWHFEASDDVIKKFKSQALQIIRNFIAGGSGNPPSLISALWNIGILHHKQATPAKHFGSECIEIQFCIALVFPMKIFQRHSKVCFPASKIAKLFSNLDGPNKPQKYKIYLNLYSTLDI